MTTDPLEKIREGLVAGVASEPARRRSRMISLAVVTVLALGAGSLALTASLQRDDRDAVTTGPDPMATNQDDDAVHPSTSVDASVWSIEQPPSWWNRADSELMPQLGSESLTLATIALEAGGNCQQYPEQALRAMSSADALFTIYYGTSAEAGLETWPGDGLGADDVPIVEGRDLVECAQRGDFEIRQGRWNLAGQTVSALIVFGSDVTDDRREELWSALGSFGPLGRTDEAPTPVCIVTVPPAERPQELPTTSEDGAPPPGAGWVGTADLWTALPYDGTHAPRKSVWWSEHFPGGSVEERPEIGVTWERLDREAPVIVAEKPGTNAHTGDSGWAMINGLDPASPGCWKVTAEYKGHRLSYVYWNPPVVWVHESPDEVSRDALLRGHLRFDEEHNCYLLETGGERLPIIWPAGTTASPDGTVLRMADQSEVRIEQEISGGGGIVPVDTVEEFRIPAECRGSGNVAMFNAQSPYPLPR